MLALIVDDAGYSLEELQAFLDLPMPLAVAVLPNLPHSTEAARRVLAAGKDLILHCPMEPGGGENPGPGRHLHRARARTIIRRLLDADFASVPGALGMNNHMGSKATADEAVMTVVLAVPEGPGQALRGQPDHGGHRGARGLPRRWVCPSCSGTSSWTTTRRKAKLRTRLEKGIGDARDRGSAVVIGHVQNKGVVDILRAAEGTLEARGVRMARLTDVLAERERKTAQ